MVPVTQLLYFFPTHFRPQVAELKAKIIARKAERAAAEKVGCYRAYMHNQP